jgi:hypothetical protein
MGFFWVKIGASLGDFFLKIATFKATAHYFLLEKVGFGWS